MGYGLIHNTPTERIAWWRLQLHRSLHWLCLAATITLALLAPLAGPVFALAGHAPHVREHEVTFASILFSPTSDIYLYLAIPIKAWLFGLLYLAFETYQSRRGGTNIDHSAHFWGAIFGLMLPAALKPSLLTDFLAAIFG